MKQKWEVLPRGVEGLQIQRQWETDGEEYEEGRGLGGRNLLKWERLQEGISEDSSEPPTSDCPKATHTHTHIHIYKEKTLLPTKNS